MVSAWCEANHLVLGQLATEEKSNEITAIPKLLELLDLTDAVVTIDAIGCQKNIAKKVESELTYPGEIKVTVIRETRSIGFAR